jgi:hypothetical protein
MGGLTCKYSENFPGKIVGDLIMGTIKLYSYVKCVLRFKSALSTYEPTVISII